MSFLSPLFLLGLAALAVPVIIHLVRRTRARKVEFPSLMFVRQIPQRTIRRRRLINLLLLILRSLALLCLVLAFARPFTRGSANAGLGTRSRSSVILLDNSYSMRSGNRFELAKSRARSVISQAGVSDQLALISFSQGYEVLSRLTGDRAKLNSLVDNLAPGNGSTALVQAIRGAEELLRDAGTAEKQIVLISDLQAGAWNKADASYKLSNQIKLVLADVAETPVSNLAITEVNAQPVVYQQKYTDKLTARIANYSDENREGVQVEFQLNDHTVEKRQVKVAAHESALIEFSDFNLNEGPNRGVIEISDSGFAFDNRFFVSITRVNQGQLLVIENAGRERGESLFLQNALTTGENLAFAVSVKTPVTVNPGELSAYKVIILNDADNLSGGLATALKSFVEKGGGLVVTAGRHVSESNYNEIFGTLLPAKIGEAVQLKSEYVTLSDIKTDHPVFGVFRQSGRLAAARVFGYRRSTPGQAATVLARFEDGSPALVESATGSGRVLLFLTTLDSSWNDLPLTPIYLPLVRQMTRYLGERDKSSWHLIGETFSVPPGSDGAVPAVDSPGNTRLTERNLTNGGELIIKAAEPGFYRLRYSGNTDFSAVDLDPRESDLAKLDKDEFLAAITGEGGKQGSGSQDAPKLTDEEREARQRIWWPLLIAALAFFVAEAIISRRTRVAKVIG